MLTIAPLARSESGIDLAFQISKESSPAGRPPGNSTAEGSRAPRIDSLTGIRFFAAIAVVVYHYWTDFFPGSTAPRPFDSGFMGVSLFYVLSGFILGFVYLRGSAPVIDTKKFMVARFARVYPSYALSFVIQFPLIGVLILHSQAHLRKLLIAVATLLAHLLLLQAWWTYLDWNWNPPSWSLCAEAFFYLLFPLLGLWSARQGGARRLTLLMIASYLLMLLAPAALLFRGVGWNSQPRPESFLFVVFSPLMRIPEFMTGLLLSVLHKRLKFTVGDVRLQLLGAIALSAGLACTAFVLYLGDRVPYILRYNGITDLAFAAIIFGLASSVGPLQKMLSLPIIVLLGEASYSVYIFQSPIFDYIAPLVRNPSLSSRLEKTLLFFAYICVLVGFSIACFRYFETPIRKRITGWYASSRVSGKAIRS
jgi:peptidoglycan/LPS O-acetylase OafA/YrhL